MLTGVLLQLRVGSLKLCVCACSCVCVCVCPRGRVRVRACSSWPAGREDDERGAEKKRRKEGGRGHLLLALLQRGTQGLLLLFRPVKTEYVGCWVC